MRSLFCRTRRTAAVVALAGGLSVAGGCAPAISTQQEVQLGRQYAAELERQLPIVQDRAVNQYINQLGNSIARRVDARGLNYTFRVVNAPEVNAFAVPGGFIYINRGLIERTDNMAELAGVLAHEIGHVVERHSVERIQKAQNANTALGVVYGVILGRNPSGVEQIGIQGIGSAVFAGYSRDAEREADMQAIRYLVQSGIDPRGMVTFFQELLSEQRRQPSAVERWFSTHPLAQERVENAQQVIAALPPGTLNGLANNTQQFEQFKARVRSLPAAPRR
jgi:predicted Zn-dependent protease